MNKTILAGAFACLIAAPLAAQVDPAAAPALPAANDASLDKMLKDAERDRGFAQPNSHEARIALEVYGKCTVEREPKEAARVLAMDFTKPTYRTALKLLSSEAVARCARTSVGTAAMRSSNLLFAGEVAEALLEQDRAPLSARLARAAAAGPAVSYSFTDKVAMCVVRSVPDQVAALFGTERDAPAEASALGGLAAPMAMCARAANATRPISVNPAGLRAMLATAAYRSLRSAGGAA
jgi:hypothetical protein